MRVSTRWRAHSSPAVITQSSEPSVTLTTGSVLLHPLTASPLGQRSGLSSYIFRLSRNWALQKLLAPSHSVIHGLGWRLLWRHHALLLHSVSCISFLRLMFDLGLLRQQADKQSRIYVIINIFIYYSICAGVTAVAQWLRCCATNRKVASSIPDCVIGIFHRHNSSDRTMALGSTQPLTEMSTRSISWG